MRSRSAASGSARTDRRTQAHKASGDCHVDSKHREQVSTQLARAPRPYPTLVIRRRPASTFDDEYEDFAAEGYDPASAIKAPVAV